MYGKNQNVRLEKFKCISIHCTVYKNKISLYYFVVPIYVWQNNIRHAWKVNSIFNTVRCCGVIDLFSVIIIYNTLNMSNTIVYTICSYRFVAKYIGFRGHQVLRQYFVGLFRLSLPIVSIFQQTVDPLLNYVSVRAYTESCSTHLSNHLNDQKINFQIKKKKVARL